MQVRVPADMQRAKREGKMGIIFFFESAEMLEGKIERIELFRTMPLVHASRNTSRCLLQDSRSGWICAGGDQWCRPYRDSNRVLVGLSRRFSNFPAAGVDRYEL